jgi:MFS transporter, DHA2 family, multidrug resistance protein
VMDRGDRADWFATPWVWYFSIIAGAAFVILVWHEWNTPEPIVQVRILKNRNFTIPTIMLIIMTFVMYGMQILNPIFLQDLLGYTPYKAGLAMAPRGFGVMASMFFLGGIARRGYDTRPLVALGFMLVAGASWTLGNLDLNMAMSNFIWPTVIQGVGVGLIFPNLSASALGSIPREQIGYAASLYSMTRNVGASIGTSVLTTILVHREQVQQSQLVQHLSVFDAWRLSSGGASMPGAIHFNYAGQLVTGQKQGLAMIYGTMQGQAMMLSLNSIYRMLAFIMIAAGLLCVFLPRVRGKAPAGAH